MRLRNKPAFLITALLVIMTTLLSACGGSSSGSTSDQRAPANQQILRWPIWGVADISTLDPALPSDQFSIESVSMIFDGLVALNAQQQVVPELASSWNISADKMTYTFTLKPNLKFSDGSSLTSQDVVYSINRALDPSLNSAVAPTYLGMVKDANQYQAGKIKTLIGDSLLAPDPNTVVIKLAQPTGYFLPALTYTTSYVIEKKLIDQYGETKWVDHLADGQGGGSGPFTLASYQHGKQLKFVPNPNYKTIGKVPTITVINDIIKTSDTSFQAYQNGQEDESTVPTANLGQVQNTPEFHRYDTLGTSYIGLNFLTRPFDNIKIRQAFELALNKDAIVQTVYHGIYRATNHLVPEGMPGYDPNLKGVDGTTGTKGNPTLAKQLFQQGLQEEGYTSASALPPLKIQYEADNADVSNEIAIVIQVWQTVLGAKVQASPLDFEKLVTDLNNNNGAQTFQMFMTNWGDDYPDPQDFLTLQFGGAVPQNQTNFGMDKNDSDYAQQVAAQQLMHKADVEGNSTLRYQEYNQTEQQLSDDVAWLPIYQFGRARVLKPYVHGVTFNAGDFIPNDAWAGIYITQH